MHATCGAKLNVGRATGSQKAVARLATKMGFRRGKPLWSQVIIRVSILMTSARRWVPSPRGLRPGARLDVQDPSSVKQSKEVTNLECQWTADAADHLQDLTDCSA